MNTDHYLLAGDSRQHAAHYYYRTQKIITYLFTDVEYTFLTEQTVRALDKRTESVTVFGQHIAEKIFSEEDLLLPVEDRDQKRFEWLVDVSFH